MSDAAEIRSRVVDLLKTLYDPEIPVDIWELGLIYDVEVDDGGRVDIRMTLTSPACPVAEMLPEQIELEVAALPDVTAVSIGIVWDPPWDPEMMSEAARLELGFD